jgi:uncharacterized protein YkwD
VAGTVSLIPNDGYGPVTMLGVTYAYDSTGTPLSGATVIIGPTQVIGATPPPTLPAGDVSTLTNSSGAFSATIPAAAIAPVLTPDYSNTPIATLVIPTYNITNFTAPATGYFVEVFGVGTDGISAGVPIPLHAFLGASTSLNLHVTSAASAEASALALVNADRQSNAGASPLTLDEAAEEAARLHARDQAQNSYFCHYDQHNVGPVSRYLNLGGVGLTGEANGGSAGTSTALAAFQQGETDILTEKSENPPGGHYLNLVDSAHAWAGLAAALSTTPNAYYIDYELISPPTAIDSVVGIGYSLEGCASGITANGS